MKKHVHRRNHCNWREFMSTQEPCISANYYDLTCKQSWAFQIEAETNLPSFCSQHFQMHFLERKCMNFNSNFTVVQSPNNHFPALFQIMAWRSPGDKLLSDAMIEFTGAIMRHAAPMRKPGKESLHIKEREIKSLTRIIARSVSSIWCCHALGNNELFNIYHPAAVLTT